jgi:hypothetical protein
MNDTQLGGWMRVLPRATASHAFTSEVMRKVRRDCDERRVPLAWRLAAAFAMAACLVAVVHVSVMQYSQRQRMAALRAEQQKIEAELEAVKRIASESEPFVVLEDDRGTRVIVDLDSAVQTASLRNYD